MPNAIWRIKTIFLWNVSGTTIRKKRNAVYAVKSRSDITACLVEMKKTEIQAIQAKYPKFNKVAASLASRPEETGVIFVDDICKIQGVSNDTPKVAKSNLRGLTERKSKPDIRSKANRYTVRIDDKTNEEFIKLKGNNTVQEYLERLIKEDICRKR